MKKILFPAGPSYSPHLETEMEIMEYHLMRGDDIYYVCCNREIKTCLQYQYPSEDACRLCRKHWEVGLSLLSKKVHILSWPDSPEMHLKNYYFVNNVSELKNLRIRERERERERERVRVRYERGF